MIKKITHTLPLLALLWLTTACGDWLYLEPENGIVRQEYWKTKEQAEAAVIGIYASMLDEDLVERLFLWGELRADMLTPNTGITDDELNIIQGNILETNSLSDWSSFYRTINYCNTVIELAPDVLNHDDTYTEAHLNSHLAEAYAIRALMYFYLVRTFGEVPMPLEATISDDQDLSLPKSDEATILQQMLADLTAAEAGAVETYGSVAYDKGRITLHSIHAIQADVYLWNEMYAECIAACDQVMAAGRFGLMPGNEWFSRIFAQGNSNEAIFELQFDNQKLNPFFYMFSTTTGRRFLAAERLLDEVYLIDFDDPDNKDYRADGATINSGNSTVWKYLGLTDRLRREQDASYAHWIFYRLADILLLKAEALAQTGQGEEALALIETIRTRANALEGTALQVDPQDQAGLTDYILQERLRELAFEGKRWFDVLRNTRRDNYARMDILIDMVTLSAPPDRQQSIINKYRDRRSHFMPIYLYELNTNKNLVQNPFYDQ